MNSVSKRFFFSLLSLRTKGADVCSYISAANPRGGATSQKQTSIDLISFSCLKANMGVVQGSKMYGMDFERTYVLNAPPPSKIRRRKESRIKKLRFV